MNDDRSDVPPHDGDRAAQALLQGLSVHLPCLRLRGRTEYGWQPCDCQGPVTWKGCDVSRAADLCSVCARGTAGGVSRWAWLGCEWCWSVERGLRAWLGMAVLALGRHSIMNSVGLRVSGSTADDAEEFGRALRTVETSWQRLHLWGRREARLLALTLDPRPEELTVLEWQALFPPSPAASVDAYERLLRMELPAGVRDRLLADGGQPS